MRPQKGCLVLRPFVKEKPSALEDAIERVMEHMKRVDTDTEEYSQLIAHLERLNKMKQEQKRNRISPDTMAIVCGNLLGILIIVSYERMHVMTSKGVGFILKPK
jgi:hypothetical protein